MLRGTRYWFGTGDAVRTLADRAAQTSLNDPRGLAELLTVLEGLGFGNATRTLADRAPAQASLDDPGGVAELLTVLYGDAARILADWAAQTSLGNPPGLGRPVGLSATELLRVERLLGALAEAGADAAAPTLAGQAAAQASLNDPRGVAELLRALREVGAGDAARTLLDRDPAAQASLGHRGSVAELLGALSQAGADDAARTLASRAANAGMFDLFLEVQPDEAPNYLFGREPDGTPSQPWRWEEPGQLGPWSCGGDLAADRLPIAEFAS